ncbi:RHS repeat domain-containing protein [Armatimonas sp.]|uniref:RHS repeat domain-containing protein n=1 Tax=Armatimonas sp. TaxID=1872638 RepID=UPI0037510A03
MDRAILTYNPLSQVSHSLWGFNGELKAATDARGQVLTNSYMSGDRLAQTTYKDVTGTIVSSTSYAYDPQLKYQLNDISDLPPATGTPQLYHFGYDSVHRLRTIVTPLGTKNYAEFDSLDRLKRVVEDGTETTLYNYDDLGRIWKTENSVVGDTTMEFDFLGQTTKVTKPNGLEQLTGYDAIGRAETTQTKFNGTLVRGRKYSYDASGAISQEKNLDGSQVLASYTYDGLRRLTKAVRGGSTYDYSYDDANNRIGETLTNNATSTRAFAYDWANRLTSMTSGSGTLTADHDANGNMTRLGSDYLGWNVRGQLASMTSGGQSSTFGYDLYNRRISKNVSGGNARSYKWSGWSSHGGTGSGVFAKTTGVDNHASLGGNATVTDHLGSVVTLLNSSGAPAQQNSFDPFGQVISSVNSNGFGGQPYGFTGLEHDASGLVYARNRYYSPGLGRFISDSMVYSGALSLCVVP